MALPTLPTGYAFTVDIIDGPRIAVAIVATADGSVQSNEFVDAKSIVTEPALTAAVEAAATDLANVFNQAQNLQTWVDTNWPAPTPPPSS